MKAVVLCGGLGTRLGDLTRCTPKPLMIVAGKEFLKYILDMLVTCQVNEIILSVGFQWEKIRDLIGFEWKGIPITYSIESTPLGTGGAIKFAINNADLDEALVVNGDSFFQIDFDEFILDSKKANADIFIALKKVNYSGRYGTVDVNNNGELISFLEKSEGDSPGIINSGIYFLKKCIFDKFSEEKFSFELDLLSHFSEKKIKVCGKVFDNYFIDIGVPEDLLRADKDLALGVHESK